MKIQDPKTSLISILIFIAGTSVQAQDKATDWFERGLSENNINSRIAAFEKTIALDPDYVEAYFYLGSAYKQKNMFNEAELALHKAYFKNPYALSKEIKLRILFEMGIVKSNLGKTIEAMDSLKGAKALAGNNNALKSRIQYELGLVYIRNGDYQLALKELREGRDIIPQNADLFNKAITEAESNKGILKAYNSGLSLLNNSKYQQAIQQFEQVIRQNANFKDVQVKLTKAKKNQTNSKTNNRINAIYQQALTAEQKKNNQLARKLFQQVAKEAPNFRDVANKLRRLQISQPAPPPAKTSNIERLYVSGKANLSNKKFARAITAFRQIKTIQTTYKDTDKLLTQAQNELTRQSTKDKKLETQYMEGLNFLTNKDWSNALSRFREVQQIKPGYKEVEQKMLDLKQAIAAEKKMLTSIDSLYQKGSLALQNENWLMAIVAFEKVEALLPEYKDTAQKLLEANINIKDINLDKYDTSQPNLILITSMVFLTLLIPIAGGLIFSPTLKARMYLIKGNYNDAALLLEQIISKKPEKLKLYALLAHIYLLEDRQDETALKTYEMILKLNIITPKRVQINSIVANHYLKLGKNDYTAIDVMEKELSYKLNKQQSGPAN